MEKPAMQMPLTLVIGMFDPISLARSHTQTRTHTHTHIHTHNAFPVCHAYLNAFQSKLDTREGDKEN